MSIPIFNTFVHPLGYKNVKSTLDSTFISEGKIVKEFEDQLEKKLSIKNPVTVNSGTSALHLSLILAGVKQGDEVILSAQTFVASGLTIIQTGAKPIFADIEYETGNIDPKSIESKITKKTKAIMVVHWGGTPCDMDKINKIAKKYNLIVIEDAAHALGALYKNKPIGTISDFTCFSFQAIKHLTTGDGGAICCKNKKNTERAFIKRWFGIDRANSKPSILGERIYDINELGFKYHMNDYAATLGLANLQGFKKRLKRRRLIAKKYKTAFKDLPKIKLFREDPKTESAYWLFGMHVEDRNNFISTLKNEGITASVVHLGIDKNSIFGGTKKELTNQRKFDETQIHIPIHDGLTDENIKHIINTIKKGW